MYEEQVKRLREESEIERWLQPHSANETPKLLNDAADAIEELSAYVQQIKKLRKDGYYLMRTYGTATMTMPLPEPPKEVPADV